jgi:hypothetical protein
MTERFIPYTSAFACDDIARETLRKTYGDSRSLVAATEISNKLLRPLATQIVGAGKVRRGEIRTMATALCRRLENEPTVVSTVAEHRVGSKISSKEESRLSVILALADDDDRDWLDFVSSEVFMQRTSLQITHSVMDFRMHRHALSRFMQRERKPAEGIMANILQSLQMASLFGNLSIALTGTENFATPIGDGMLFGRLSAYSNVRDPAMMSIIRFERHKDPMDWDEARPDHLVKGARANVEIMTYVGDKQLTPAREKLRDRMRDYRERHGAALAMMFDSHYYPNAAVPTADVDRLKDAVRAATAEAETILTGREWAQFSHSVGTGPNG